MEHEEAYKKREALDKLFNEAYAVIYPIRDAISSCKEHANNKCFNAPLDSDERIVADYFMKEVMAATDNLLDAVEKIHNSHTRFAAVVDRNSEIREVFMKNFDND